MKRIFLVVSATLVLIVTFLFISSGCNIQKEKDSYHVKYEASQGGYLRGTIEQMVQRGKDGEEVTAYPDPRFAFLEWSDGIKSATRYESHVQKDVLLVAFFTPLPKYTIEYSSGENGRIVGAKVQSVVEGENGSQIEVIPDFGYEFSGWSDGSKEKVRIDRNVKSNFKATAYFRKKHFQVKYKANPGGEIQGISHQSIEYQSESEKVIAVPAPGYRFLSWSDGVSTPERNDFNVQADMEVRANFASSEATHFKILMVFATEVHATLSTRDNIEVKVDYSMTDQEKKIYDLIPQKFGALLNDAFKGDVIFDVDTYYLKNPLTEKNLVCGIDNGFYTYGITLYFIPELQDIIKGYRTVITTFSMNDFDNIVHHVAGSARRKEAFVHAETIFGGPLGIEKLLDLSDPTSIRFWNSYLDTYCHEFAHTAEAYYSYPEDLPETLHSVESYYAAMGEVGYGPVLKYLLRETSINGVITGIPKSYWLEEPKLKRQI